ncbi:MAG: DUF4302 domain-containing protein [Chitinophagaceae bacterium]|nr:DUF4302 domain-containing protein [Chitinophagaceae bacterium]
MLFVAACKKDDKVFNESPDERINKTLADYQAALVSSPTGWKATITPELGGIYHFYFQFNAENRVFMYADFDTTTAKYKKESSYRLKALQQPSLIFDTYSYLHLLADPDGNVNGGIDGVGLSSDFEFAFDSVYADSIVLTGKINNTKLKLEKATQEDLDAWQNGNWAGTISFLNINAILNYFKRLTIGGTEYEISVDPITRVIVFQWLSGTTLKQFATTFYFDASGVVLDNPLVNGSQTINGFNNISWNGTTQTLQVKSGNSVGTVKGAIEPLKTDVAAPQRWWQEAINQDGYWYSRSGFHANGVDDAFNINSLSKYYYLIYWPGYDAGSNDLFAPVFVNDAGDALELQYGAAPGVPQFTNDGRAVFTLLGNYGTYPATGPAALSRDQLFITEGYYLVQTGNKSYDMVSAKDAKTWVSWIGAW